MKMMKRGMTAMYRMLGISLLAAAAYPGAFGGAAEAHVVSSWEEHEIGQAAAERVEEKYEVVSDDDLLEIQRRLVVCNPGTLNRRDGMHKRWLEPIKMYHSDSPNAFMLPGGYSYMADSMVNFINTVQNDGYINKHYLRPMNKSNIYNTSAVAFVMGHEFGHWAGKDHLESYDKQFGLNLIASFLGMGGSSMSAATAQSIGINLVDTLWERKMSLSQEYGADEWGLKFLENVPEYSTGGALMKFDRFLRLEEIRFPDGKRPKNFRNPHPQTMKRYQRTMKYIANSSNGRVKIDNGDLYVDNQLIPLDGRADVVSKERVFYVAGQIAAAIKKDMFHPRNLTFVSVPKSIDARDPARVDEMYFIAVNDAGTDYKIIDKVRYNESLSFEDNMEVVTSSKEDMGAMGVIFQVAEAYDAQKDVDRKGGARTAKGAKR
jgi:hypothetical protein